MVAVTRAAALAAVETFWPPADVDVAAVAAGAAVAAVAAVADVAAVAAVTVV